MVSYQTVAVARQPIVDDKLAVFAYELLYRRDSEAKEAEIIDDVGATAQVITSSLLDIGLNNIVGNNEAFVNFPRSYLTNPSGVPLPRDTAVIEVLENAGFDPILLAALRRWKGAGYKLALDDFQFEAKLTPFVELADYVKLDLLALGKEAFHAQVTALKAFDVKIIAEKVETWDDFHFAKLLEVDYYQGYFFERPQVLTNKSTTVNQMTLLQLMAALIKNSDGDIDEIEKIVSQDVGLVHKLLKYLNSPMTGLVASVDTVKLAITLIGVDHLKSLTNLLLMSAMTEDRPAVLSQVLVRSKHAELYATEKGYSNLDRFFLAGMMSMIDVCVGQQLDDVLAELPLPDEFKKSIVERTGRVGHALELVELFEKSRLIQDEHDREIIQKTYVEALKWVDEFMARI
ncbi:EAL and HDOD domain-containing protein [Marinomonas balearica]|uniref:EAL and modified HD-GYP domain-containing signal transduction protein n=1 Tax=Marinomonas balearica TaxID=491947 RepID=A0A4R6MHP4_9GAMM|nr:HDOD domain-containing protein [Marinomonas balearica]TDP01087.1 EAL and modified HD-GYP domain-containing signal transduction protein [Marinomonas balearica]